MVNLQLSPRPQAIHQHPSSSVRSSTMHLAHTVPSSPLPSSRSTRQSPNTSARAAPVDRPGWATHSACVVTSGYCARISGSDARVSRQLGAAPQSVHDILLSAGASLEPWNVNLAVAVALSQQATTEQLLPGPGYQRGRDGMQMPLNSTPFSGSAASPRGSAGAGRGRVPALFTPRHGPGWAGAGMKLLL